MSGNDGRGRSSALGPKAGVRRPGSGPGAMQKFELTRYLKQLSGPVTARPKNKRPARQAREAARVIDRTRETASGNGPRQKATVAARFQLHQNFGRSYQDEERNAEWRRLSANEVHGS
jgi:hypothetical protein